MRRHEGPGRIRPVRLGRRGNQVVAVAAAVRAVVLLSEETGRIARGLGWVSFWCPVLTCVGTVLICGPTVCWALGNLAAIERRRWLADNRCGECGYPREFLRAGSTVCPECGSAAAGEAAGGEGR